MLSVFETLLLVIDVQERLFPHIQDKTPLAKNLKSIIQGAHVFHIPVLYTEQAPEKLGPTVGDIAPLLTNCEKFSKLTFSCCGQPDLVVRISALKKKDIILTGIEAHVCVYQTAIDLIKMGFNVYVIVDAVSSRTAFNKEIGLNLISKAGGTLASVETVLCALLKKAEGREFKEILPLIK